MSDRPQSRCSLAARNTFWGLRSILNGTILSGMGSPCFELLIGIFLKNFKQFYSIIHAYGYIYNNLQSVPSGWDGKVTRRVPSHRWKWIPTVEHPRGRRGEERPGGAV